MTLVSEIPAQLAPPPAGFLLLTIDQAAERLQVSRSSLYREIRRGHLPVVKIGHLTRIRLDALDSYARSLETVGLP